MTVKHGAIVRLVSTEAIAEALELLAQHLRAGLVVGFSLEVAPTRSARLSVSYADGAAEVELPGVAAEDDESAG